MKVAAYQAPLRAGSMGLMEALGLIRTRVRQCEVEGVTILCCPEAILGGLADYSENPAQFAVAAGQLDTALAPIASETVTTIVGLTELGDGGRLYNSAAVFQRGSVVGLYRKLYPAINRSVYEAGDQMPVFRAGDLIFGILICNDSNYLEPARIMAARGAAAFFVPTNNGLPPEKTYKDLVTHARNVDIARAIDNSVWVIRADVVVHTAELHSDGSSGIVDPNGMVLLSAERSTEDLLVAELDTSRHERRRGWDASRNRAVVEEYVRLVSQNP